MRPLLALPVFVFLLLATTGCVSHSPVACGGKGRSARVFFATDRRQQPTDAVSLHFGPERNRPPGLNLGWEEISFGPQHRVGQLDDAVAIAPAHSETPSVGGERSSALQRTDVQIDAFVNNTLRPAIRAARPPVAGGPRHVFVFVHGFNTSFDEAIRKTGQFAGDLDLVNCAGQAQGVAIAYSWPSGSALFGYLADEENAEWTQQRLAPFLRALTRVCQAEGARLHLVAHSMGSRALIRSLSELANGCEKPGRLADDVILLAPDMGRGLFDQYIDRVLPLIGHLTIYVSARDEALTISSFLHGGHHRLGLLESTVYAALQLTGLARDHRDLGELSQSAPNGKFDMIDVTHSLANHFGHSYEDPAFIRDFHELVIHGAPAGAGSRANLQPRQTHQNIFFGRAGESLHYFQLQGQ